MNYKEFGLVNTRAMFADALRRHYAVPAFNFYNMETLTAILSAARETKSPVILAVSESALNYMGEKNLIGLMRGQKFKPRDCVALHLDHGKNFEICKLAISLGFSSVMIDASDKNFAENVKISGKVAQYAHKFDVSVEAELGTLSGIEDENVFGEKSNYTNPADAVKFVAETGIDSLAVAIGTSHGAYKRRSRSEKLRFDILKEIAKKLPNFPLVLHGASSIPQKFVAQINKFGGDIRGAMGTPSEQLKKAVKINICKINVDSDSRLAMTAGVRESLAENPKNFDPRKYFLSGTENIRQNCMREIKEIMCSDNKL